MGLELAKLSAGYQRPIVFIGSLLIFSLLGTVLHEYLHYLGLLALGGEGRLSFGWGWRIFPWDESHVIPSKMPPDLSGRLAFYTIGGLGASLTLLSIYLGAKGLVRAAAEFALLAQVGWALAEPLWFLLLPLAASAPSMLFLASVFQPYYAILFGSWLLGFVHLRYLRKGSPNNSVKDRTSGA